MHSKTFFKLICIFFTSVLAGCKTYSVSVNNNLVYTPPSIFKNFSIADANLRACVEQTILDKRITKAEELKQLNCSHAGIKSLAGLEAFYAIEQLNLAENALQSITPLTTISALKVLILRKNNLTNAEPLLHLMALQEVDVSENENMNCRDLTQLATNFAHDKLKLTLPQHCR